MSDDDEDNGMSLMDGGHTLEERLKKEMEEYNSKILKERHEEKQAANKVADFSNRGRRREFSGRGSRRGGFRRGGFGGRDRFPDRNRGREFGRRPPRRRSGSRDRPGAPFGNNNRKRSRSGSQQRRRNNNSGNPTRYQRPSRSQIYGLAKSSAARTFRTDEITNDTENGEGKTINRRGPYQPHLVAQAQDDSESSDEEVGLGVGLNQMMSLVTKPEGASSSDSDDDSDDSSESGEQSDSNEKGKVGRKRKAPVKRSSEFAKREFPKRRRVEVINKLEKDEKHKQRSKRMFGFLMKHLGKAQKESKKRTDITRKMNEQAKEIREKQKQQVFSDYKERQIQIYEKRRKFRRQKIEVLLWKKQHAENLLRVRHMKKEFEAKTNVCVTKAEPPCYFRFAPLLEGEEEDPEIDKLIQETNERMEKILIEQIKAIEEAEGEEPPEPAPLEREVELSPERGIRPNNENSSFGSGNSSFGSGKPAFAGNRKKGEDKKGVRERPARERGERPERGEKRVERKSRDVRDRNNRDRNKGDRGRDRNERNDRRKRDDRKERKNRSTKNITTNSFRSRGGKDDASSEKVVPAIASGFNEERMQSLISMPED